MKKRLIQRNHVLFALAGLAAACASLPVLSASPPTYRWTDANGTVHYEQTPPVGRPYETLHPDALPASTVPPTDDAEKAFLKSAADEDARKAKERDTAAAQQSDLSAQCAAARGQLQFLDTHPPARLMIRDDSGETKRMDANDWDAQRKTASAAIASSCSP